MALHLKDACYETQNQVMSLLMFTTLFIEGNIIKSKTKNCLKILQFITNSAGLCKIYSY